MHQEEQRIRRTDIEICDLTKGAADTPMATGVDAGVLEVWREDSIQVAIDDHVEPPEVGLAEGVRDVGVVPKLHRDEWTEVSTEA